MLIIDNKIFSINFMFFELMEFLAWSSNLKLLVLIKFELQNENCVYLKAVCTSGFKVSREGW